MARSGRCHCGAISYTVQGEPAHHALCHCADCSRSAGAYAVGWALFPEWALSVTGEPMTYASSPGATRQFCGTCGSGLFYRNGAIFPDQVDVQTATLDDPSSLPAQARIQAADAPEWMARFGELPVFQRFPG